MPISIVAAILILLAVSALYIYALYLAWQGKRAARERGDTRNNDGAPTSPDSPLAGAQSAPEMTFVYSKGSAAEESEMLDVAVNITLPIPNPHKPRPIDQRTTRPIGVKPLAKATRPLSYAPH